MPAIAANALISHPTSDSANHAASHPASGFASQPVGHPATSHPAIGQLLALRQHLSIVHQLPGRIRLRIAASLFSQIHDFDLDTVKGVLASSHGIQDVRLNPAAATVIIEYDPTRLTPGLWPALLHGEEAEARTIIGQLLQGVG